MNDWLERYLYAVSRRLPKSMRADIERELRSNLLDALDERTGGREATEAEILALLNEFGDPQQVAAEYMPENRYLIGPELIDLYWLIMKIAAFGVTIGLTVALVVSVFQSETAMASPISAIGHYVGTIWSALISLVGTVTIIFAVIQFSMRGEGADASKTAKGIESTRRELLEAVESVKSEVQPHGRITKTSVQNEDKGLWSANKLPAVPAPSDRASLAESIASLVFIGLALLVFNVYPDKIGAYFYDGALERWNVIPLFNVAVLSVYVLFFNIIWGLEILLNIRLIQAGKWGLWERGLKILTSLLGLAVFIAIVQNPAVFNLEGIRAAFLQFGFPLESFSRLGNLNLKILIAIVVIANLAEVVKQVFLAAKSRLA